MNRPTPPTENLTEQVIFDFVVNHLRTQDRQCYSDEHGCQYRGEGGTACAVGALLLDEEVTSAVEGHGVSTLNNRGHLPGRLVPFVLLLGDLQCTHDIRNHWNNGGFGPRGEAYLEETANRYNLTYTPPTGA